MNQQQPNVCTLDGYYEQFYLYIAGGYLHRESWEQVEREYFDKTGTNRYTSYDSFKSSKHQYMNKKK